MRSILGRLAASVTSTRAPLSAKRNASASSPNKVKSGIAIRPARYAATWAIAASGD